MGAGERHGDHPEHGALDDAGVAAERVFGFVFVNAVGKAVAFAVQNDVPLLPWDTIRSRHMRGN